MYHSCTICSELLFDVLKDLTILPYEHTMYLDCAEEMEQCQHHSCHVWSMGLERLVMKKSRPSIINSIKIQLKYRCDRDVCILEWSSTLTGQVSVIFCKWVCI
ncbi:unnamed protein product [Lactuca virosa]|uniref:Uncharacterized protein n=1 Tax=Lactuca virosa TaxID=75947 RepID=A0AAU9M156_9ASTR|nr:unnamed protein product [Lactuca virosa]